MPAARLPDQEQVLIEPTYGLEGRSLDKAGPDAGLEVGPGEFVWRPAGSRHAAWSPDGALMIAIFQVPNRFCDKDGRDLYGSLSLILGKRSACGRLAGIHSPRP